MWNLKREDGIGSTMVCGALCIDSEVGHFMNVLASVTYSDGAFYLLTEAVSALRVIIQEPLQKSARCTYQCCT